jgi:hypothetical protein
MCFRPLNFLFYYLGVVKHMYCTCTEVLISTIPPYTTLRPPLNELYRYLYSQEAKPMRIRIRILVRLKSHTVEFLHKNILQVGIGQKTYIRRYKSPFERQKTRFICKFWSISMLLDQDPRQPNECGSRWIRIRIHNTVFGQSTGIPFL